MNRKSHAREGIMPALAGRANVRRRGRNASHSDPRVLVPVPVRKPPVDTGQGLFLRLSRTFHGVRRPASSIGRARRRGRRPARARRAAGRRRSRGVGELARRRGYTRRDPCQQRTVRLLRQWEANRTLLGGRRRRPRCHPVERRPGALRGCSSLPVAFRSLVRLTSARRSRESGSIGSEASAGREPGSIDPRRNCNG